MNTSLFLRWIFSWDGLRVEPHWSGVEMGVTGANTFINNELHEFSGDVGRGYFDSVSFNGVSLNRIDACVNSSIEILRAKEKTFLGIHICLVGSVEYWVDQKADSYNVSALKIKIISDELGNIKSRLHAYKETSEISIFIEEDVYKGLIHGSDKLNKTAPLNGILNLCDMEMVHKNSLRLINAPHPTNQLECLSLQGYCYAIIGEVLSRLIKNNAAAKPVVRGSAERVKSLIDSNVKSNQTTRQLACISGTNECYLKKEFKALTGCSIADYRQKQRMRHAQSLLGRGIVSIDALAAEVGYQNTDHFIKIFRRHIGIHPKEYKSSRAGHCDY